MTNPLAPQPLSPAEIADLVERTRKATRNSYAGKAADRRKRSEQAARWAHRTGQTCAEAGRQFGRCEDAVCAAWHRLFPGESVRVRRRR